MITYKADRKDNGMFFNEIDNIDDLVEFYKNSKKFIEILESVKNDLQKAYYIAPDKSSIETVVELIQRICYLHKGFFHIVKNTDRLIKSTEGDLLNDWF